MIKNLIKIKKSLLILSVIFLFLSFSSAGAQEFSSLKDFNLIIEPKTPGPAETVQVKITSFSFDVNTAYFTWLLNGRQVQEGRGKTNFNFTAGKIGSLNTIRVIALTSDNERVEKTISFRPQEVDILWESVSYAPQWYQGKTLPISNSFVRVTAFPYFFKGTTELSYKDLVYKWSLDDQFVQNASGIGQRTFLFRMPRTMEAEAKITLFVSDGANTVSRQKSIRIKNQNPKINFYEAHPLEGILSQKALSLKSLKAEERIQIIAVPFFASRLDIENLSFQWEINKRTLENTPENPNLLTFNSSADAKGLFSVNLKIEDPADIFQIIKAGFNILVE
jgi:hypothetical protein